MITTSGARRFPVVALAALSIAAMVPVRAIAQNAAAPKDDYFNFIELNGYGGWGNYSKQNGSPVSQLQQGAQVGVRLTENIWNYFSIEQAAGVYSYHRLVFRGPTENGFLIPILPIHVFQGSVDAVLHFTPRTSRFRPFVVAGVGAAGYIPNKSARGAAGPLPPEAGFQGFGSRTELETNFGAGLKYQLTPRFGLRMDARGYIGGVPSYGLPDTPINGSASMPDGMKNYGVQVTGGLTIYFGRKGEQPAPPAPAPPPPPPAPHSLSAGSISASATSVCPGDNVRLTSNASDPEGHRLSYQWSVNGNNEGGNNSEYTFTPSSSGNYRIGLHITDTASQNAAAGVDASPVEIHVGEYSRPNVSGLTADPSTLDRGQSSALHVNASGSECSGTLNYSWSASEGTVTGSGASAQFDSSTVSFNEADRSRPQSKQVNITATVTDAKGGSGSASTSVTVNYGAQVKHFGDILFPKGSARVNNCGKRVLIEQLYPMLTSNPNYDVVLVGHIDAGETPRGKSARGRHLDRDRVLQTAGVLSGGSGTCASLDRSRIRGTWVGATQETESLPTSCSVSTTPPKERKGAEVNASEAKNRRVEIWLVPKGMSLPPAARDARELPEAEMKRIGCPK